MNWCWILFEINVVQKIIHEFLAAMEIPIGIHGDDIPGLPGQPGIELGERTHFSVLVCHQLLSVNKPRTVKMLRVLVARRSVPQVFVLARVYRDEQRRGYKNFGHKPEGTPNISRIFYFVIGAGMVGSCLNWKG